MVRRRTYYRRKYEINSKANWFEFIAENLALVAAQPVLNRFKSEEADPRRLVEYLAPLVYYSIKEFGVTRIVKIVVYWLADSTLGRWILSKILILENQKIIPMLINMGILMGVYNVLGINFDPIDSIAVLSFEFGSDFASESLLFV